MEETTSKSTLPVLLPSFDSAGAVAVVLPKGGVGFANSTDGGGGALRWNVGG